MRPLPVCIASGILCILLALGGPVSAAAPVAGFSASPVSGPAPLRVSFTDASSDSPDGGVWFFGDEDWSVPVWTSVNASAGWSARRGHSSVALPGGTIVLTGGYNGGELNDTWRSADSGATWTEVSRHAGWPARYGHNTLALPDGSIVLLGGCDSTAHFYNDVWRSVDNGTTWSLENGSAGWLPRAWSGSVVTPDGSIVLIGGCGAAGDISDVWRSEDRGSTWSRMTEDAGWVPREGMSSVVTADGSIVITGGTLPAGEFQFSDVWRSTDGGMTWTLVNGSAGWAGRFGHGMVTLPDDSILLMGGFSYQNGDHRNDVWRSTDHGATWALVSPGAGWPGRCMMNCVVLPDSTVVLLGGFAGSDFDDVWHFVPPGTHAKDPYHTYRNPGTYSVALHVYNAAASGSILKPDLIRVIPLAHDYSLVLKPGWNFISMPKKLSPGNDTADIFGNVDTAGHSIWSYDAGAKRWAAMSSTSGIRVLDGIWVFSEEETGVPVWFDYDPISTPPAKRLSAGWNALGFSDLNATSARMTLDSVRDDWSQVIGFDAGSQRYEISVINRGTGIHDDSREMQPGKGYWAYMIRDGELAAISA